MWNMSANIDELRIFPEDIITLNDSLTLRLYFYGKKML
jgi:hypothetical protein